MSKKEDSENNEAAIDQHQNAPDLAQQMQLVKSHMSQGRDLWWKADFEGGANAKDNAKEAIMMFEKIIHAHKDSQDIKLQEQVAQAYMYQAQAYELVDRKDEKLNCYTNLIDRYGKAKAVSIKEYVSEALLSKGVMLGEQGEHTLELKQYDLLLQANQTTPTLRLSKAVAKAYYNKGSVLSDKGRVIEALEVYTGLVNKFKDHSDLSIENTVKAASQKIASLKETPKQ